MPYSPKRKRDIFNGSEDFVAALAWKKEELRIAHRSANHCTDTVWSWMTCSPSPRMAALVLLRLWKEQSKIVQEMLNAFLMLSPLSTKSSRNSLLGKKMEFPSSIFARLQEIEFYCFPKWSPSVWPWTYRVSHFGCTWWIWPQRNIQIPLSEEIPNGKIDEKEMNAHRICLRLRILPGSSTSMRISGKSTP